MEERDDLITLVDEDGVEQDFDVIMTLEVEEKEYAILSPVDADEEEDAYIFKLVEDGKGEYILEALEDDDEYTNVVAAYEAIVEEEIGREEE
ncbi:DUF1292 domain-containing protein [Serpentinicella sp. ANB-PHB4]|uniref:DUF1292 domain-containing protein n=1 Tax=Serpentinicella sp. ANB-PHB4 TaxID=3074076 RepID=UPI00285AACF0|nr:DUF1292 domain-containing protein [Serpentinicella sp. ANB-PHB4]MDR5658107.1 DUF1292 domain-containing protein [Serpentinicella sp. ANB-PHB4]